MPQANLTITVRRLNDHIVSLDFQGEITAFAEQKLMDVYSQATAEGATVLVLNLTNLEYMNSSGIGLLVMLLVRANRQKQRVVAYGLTEHYRNIFELTRLNEAIQLFDTEQDALAHLTPA